MKALAQAKYTAFLFKETFPIASMLDLYKREWPARWKDDILGLLINDEGAIMLCHHEKQTNWESYFKYKTPLDSAPHNVGWSRQRPSHLRLSDTAQIEMICVVGIVGVVIERSWTIQLCLVGFC